MEAYTEFRPRSRPGLRTNEAAARGIKAAWTRRAAELARWFDQHLVNRRDAFGHYIAIEQRRDPDLTAFTDKTGVTRKVLERHIRGASTGDRIGLHSTSRDEPSGEGQVAACWSRWLAVDIDRHDDTVDPEATWKAALAWCDRARALGFHVLLIDSNGRGGYHLWLIFDGPVPTEKVHAFGKWLIRDWKDLGLAGPPETFPKQPAIKAGGFGNWLRLPGPHHTRDHWSRVWDVEGKRWLEDAEAVEAILATTGTPASAIPAEALEQPKPARQPKRTKAGTGLDRDARLAREALGHLGQLAENYDDWIRIGQALTPLGTVGLELWDEWSSQSAKFQEGACERKWRTFSRDGGRTLGTLFHEAERNGWQGQKRKLPSGRNEQHSNSQPAGKAAVSPSGNGQPPGDALPPATFSNAGDDNQPLRMGELRARLREIAGEWPRRVGDTLFFEGPDCKPVYLDSSAKLFAWIDSQAQVDWTKGRRHVTQERFYEHLRMTAESFDAIDTIPHWPPVRGVYYMHRPLPPATGKSLETLVDRFSPDTPGDRELIKAFVLTMVWGGPPGRRPGFLVTGTDHDPGQGRGSGKTTLVDVLTDELVEGGISVSPTDPIAEVKTRLLSKDGLRKRVARLDNVKTLKFSWADLEDLITASEISGRALYVGEGRRPNTLLWAITLNGASLSKDMAQRCAVLKLRRPTYSPSWEEETRAYAREHCREILADAVAVLKTEVPPITARTRWAAWEQGVLSRVANPQQCQELIVTRQESIDDGNQERDLVADHFARKLEALNYDPEAACVLIPSRLAAEWLSEATRTFYQTGTASTHLGGLSIPELKPFRRYRGRGWEWRGEKAAPNAESHWLRGTEPGRDDAHDAHDATMTRNGNGVVMHEPHAGQRVPC